MRRENTQQMRNPEFLAGEEFKVAQLTFAFNKVETFENQLAELKDEVSKAKVSKSEIIDFGNEKKYAILRGMNAEKHYLENKLALLQARQDLITPEYIENHYKDISDFEHNRVLAALDKKFKNLPKYQNRLEHVQKVLSSLDVGQKNTDKKTPPNKMLINRKGFYLLLLFIFSLGDALLGYNAMLILGEGIPNIALAWLTALTASATGIGAHFSGKILAKHGFTKEFVAAFLISISFVFILIWIRTDIQSSAILSILNAAFFAMAALISYRRYLTQDYWDQENLVVRLKDKEATLYSKIEGLQNRVSLDKEAIHIKLRNRAKELSTQDILHNNQKMMELQNALNGMHKVEKAYQRRADLIVEAALTKVREKEERSKNSVFSSIKSLFRPKKFAQNGTLIITAMLFLNACSTKIDTFDVVVLMDLTEQYNAFPNASTVIQDIGDFNAGQVTLSAITDTHTYPYHVINLESPKPYLMQVKEEEDSRQGNFKSNFKAAYETLSVPTEELQYSFVFSAMNTHLVKLSASSAEHKHFLCYSDLLQHSPRFSFYAYRNNPKQILKDYDRIVSKFEAEYGDIKSMNLNGIDITVMYTPQKLNDALYYHTSQFWTKFFKSKGAGTIKFVPLLPSHADKIKIAAQTQ